MTAIPVRSGPVRLTDASYHLLDAYLQHHFGLWFPAHRRAILEARLQERLRVLNLDDFLAYHRLLEARGPHERPHLARAVANHETHFFRETAQFDALTRAVLPSRASRAPVRLLSAGCSSGEEAYTLRFWLEAAGVTATIDAFDLDGERVGMATRGWFRERSVRGMSGSQIARYLGPAGPRTFAVRAAFRRGIRFRTGNLIDAGTFGWGGPYDAVFCRNVLMYFSEAAVRRAVRGVIGVLRPGGYLFLGSAESLAGGFPELETVRAGSCLAYRRRPG